MMRMALAEYLIGWALAIMPRDHDATRVWARAIAAATTELLGDAGGGN